MPWYGYLLCAVFVYLIGFIAGRATGRGEILSQGLAPKNGPSMEDLSRMLANQKVQVPGER